MSDNETRDRIRALVRDVLDNALPDEEKSAPKAAPSVTRFIDTAPNPAASDKKVHDESSKNVITEDDVRDLPEGSALRIAESARFTSLAADIIKAKGIEVLKRVPRRGSKGSKMIAVGADHGGFKMKEDSRRFFKSWVIRFTTSGRIRKTRWTIRTWPTPSARVSPKGALKWGS